MMKLRLRARHVLLAMVVAAGGCVTNDGGEEAVRYVDDFDLSHTSC